MTAPDRNGEPEGRRQPANQPAWSLRVTSLLVNQLGSYLHHLVTVAPPGR